MSASPTRGEIAIVRAFVKRVDYRVTRPTTGLGAMRADPWEQALMAELAALERQVEGEEGI